MEIKVEDKEKPTFKQKVKEFFVFLSIQLVLYILLVINFRAISQGGYTVTVVTDFSVASFQFFVIKKIADSSESAHQWAGYAIGGGLGGAIGIWISQNWVGH